jgi:hypothetical protein
MCDRGTVKKNGNAALSSIVVVLQEAIAALQELLAKLTTDIMAIFKKKKLRLQTFLLSQKKKGEHCGYILK